MNMLLKTATHLLRYATVVFIMIFALCGTSVADDTEIYFGGAGGQGIEQTQPNILLIIDTSNSMSRLVPGGDSRIEVMIEALDQILVGLGGVNVGLMRFNGTPLVPGEPRNPASIIPAGRQYFATGGPIVFPITPLSNIANTVPGIPNTAITDYTAQIATGIDDVVVVETTPIRFVVDGVRLALGEVNDPSVTIDVNATVSSGSDDALQTRANGVMLLSERSLFTLRGSSERVIGLRFAGINIPVGATIVEAEITVGAGQPSTSANRNDSYSVRGERSLNPPTFTTTSSDITNRPLSNTSVTWEPGRWFTINATDTIDVTSVVDELYTLNPTSNSMVFVLRTANGTGGRRIDTFETTGSRAYPAQLKISYALGVQVKQQVGLRFDNIPIAKDSTIGSAYLEFSVVDNDTSITVDYDGNGTSIDHIDVVHSARRLGGRD